MSKAPLGSYALLAASMALVGSYVALSKMLVTFFPVFLLAWLRFAAAAVAMLGWMRRSPREPMLSPGDRRLLFWESAIGNFLFSICMLYGVGLTSAVAGGVSLSAIPAAVALLSWLWLAERIGMRMIAAIALAMAGIGLLAFARGAAPSGEGVAGGASLAGYALLIAAAFCEATYVVIGKRLAAQVSPRRISALINLWGLALMTPLGIWQALSFDFAAVPWAIWGWLVFYALAASMVAVWLWMQGLRHVPAAQASVFVVMLPLSSTAVGSLLLGERLGAMHIAALGLAIAGLVLATWPGRA